jgi:quercetin dioxygenase-like cupin family protein
MAHHIRYIPAGQGTRRNSVDAIATVLVDADDTDGSYEVFLVDAPPGSMLPPNRHAWPEAYHLLDGELAVRVGARELTLRPGDSLTIPPNAVHSFHVGAHPARFVAVTLGDGAGKLFADLDRTVPSGAPTPGVIPVLLEVAARNGAPIQLS